MLLLVTLSLVGMVILILSTDQFVLGASRIAAGRNVSSVLVGAVILGCGVGLPELALAFHRHSFSWKQALDIGSSGSSHIGFFILILVLVFAFSIPIVFPEHFPRHSPLILFATIAFASLLRGSLDRYEGMAMLVGFVMGIAWWMLSIPPPPEDPFAPIISDDYEAHRGPYIEAPVMTPSQIESTRIMLGLLGTAVGAQMLALSAGNMFEHLGASELMISAVVATVASVLPHVVVAYQALKHDNERLAVGNMIGSNFFQSLVIGGLVAVIRPYEAGGSLDLGLLGAAAATSVLTYILLNTDVEMSRKQGVALMGSYLALVVFTVL